MRKVNNTIPLLFNKSKTTAGLRTLVRALRRRPGVSDCVFHDVEPWCRGAIDERRPREIGSAPEESQKEFMAVEGRSAYAIWKDKRKSG